MNFQRETIKRIIITGKIEESKESLIYCYRNGYTVVTCGLYSNSHRYDNSRFKTIAEKIVLK